MRAGNGRSSDKSPPKLFDHVTLGQVVRARAYMSSEDELALLRGPIPTSAVISEISDWWFITVALAKMRAKGVFLIGSHKTRESPSMTSPVAAIQNSLVLTQSGARYRLVGEPSPKPDLALICSILGHGERRSEPI